jgi:hypothetical protein
MGGLKIGAIGTIVNSMTVAPFMNRAIKIKVVLKDIR